MPASDTRSRCGPLHRRLLPPPRLPEICEAGRTVRRCPRRTICRTSGTSSGASVADSCPPPLTTSTPPPPPPRLDLTRGGELRAAPSPPTRDLLRCLPPPTGVGRPLLSSTMHTWIPRRHSGRSCSPASPSLRGSIGGSSTRNSYCFSLKATYGGKSPPPPPSRRTEWRGVLQPTRADRSERECVSLLHTSCGAAPQSRRERGSIGAPGCTCTPPRP